MNTHTAYTGKRDPINCPANQPKPTVFTEPERCPRCKGTGFIGKAVDVEGKPTSASGEWTAETVKLLYGDLYAPDGWKVVADTHNSALADERLKYQRSQEKVTEYFDLLAAERENLRVAQVEIQRLLQERAARPKMKEGK